MYSPFIHSSNFTHQSHSLTQDHMETTWPMYKPACALGLVEYVPGLKALPELTRSTISSLAPGLSRTVIISHVFPPPAAVDDGMAYSSSKSKHQPRGPKCDI